MPDSETKELIIIVSNAQIVKQLSQKLRCSEIFAHILATRGLQDADGARRFMAASLAHIDLDNCLYDMDRAVTRIVIALQNRERMLVFGDYDVDGITATLILKDFLQQCGGLVTYYIPHRLTEGYGLYPHHIENFEEKPDLIITVDCGASSLEAIEYARAVGIDVIITDHHRVEDPLEPACAHVNPKRPECMSGKTYLCGVGIVFLLLIHLRKALRAVDFWKESTCEPNLKQYCDLVALGTIADVCPLTGENRIFVKEGLKILNSAPRVGLQALITQNCKDDTIDSQAAAFRMIPVLNAAGRMQHAEYALNLLDANDEATAAKLTKELLTLNRKRQTMEQETLQVILDVLETNPVLLQQKALVITGKNWHEGILGILAARLADRFQKPALVLSERKGRLKGSGRTPAWLDLFHCLSDCAEFLTNFGGHRLAVGLSLSADNLLAFKTAFANAVDAYAPKPASIQIDAEITLNKITPALVDELERLEPFGAGNNEPLFLARGVQVADSRLIGSKNNHLKLRLQQNGSAVFDAIHFNYDKMQRPGDQIERLLFHLRWNVWRGQKKVQIIVMET